MTEPMVEVTASGQGSVALRDNYGEIHTQVNQYTGRPVVSWPYRVGVVPPLAAGYQPRADPGMDLGQVLGGRPSGAAGLTQVLSGMGGIGKTQLAAAYAHRLWDGGGLDLLVWLTATGRDAILIGYAEAGADLT